MPELSAIQSWLARLSRRTFRPSAMIGTITAGTISSTRPVSLGEVSSIITSPPKNSSRLRRNHDTDEPITDRIRVVSVVIRLRTSPVMVLS